MGLYQKVRPKKFSEVVGNSTTIGALENMVRSPEVDRPHAIMMYGPSGTGKTTVARILAYEFGGDENSLFEVNAANTRGLDSVRDIAKDAHLTALGGKPKTYIIDESHQLTPAAQEAFLKIIEDYPPDTYFIFCTTEPKGLIQTIRNRCTSYEMSVLSVQKILDLLNMVCQKEKLEVPDEILQAIAATTNGSPRAAIVSLEAVKDIKDLDTAIRLLIRGTENDPQVIELCKLLYAEPTVRRQKWQVILETFDSLTDAPETIRKSILTYLYRKLVSVGSESEALDLAHLIRIFSVSVFYGNKAQLGSMVAHACFSENQYKKEV